jgi:NCS1 family nucleobase:cation symporter-1
MSSTQRLHNYRFAIGYIYSFIASGVFYWALMRFFPHQESRLESPNTGEDIIAASDEKQILSGARKQQRGIRDLVRAILHKKKDRSSA